ncbi:MAG: hypothetical protein K1V84_04155 [Muribaculaceae bacterium]
MPKKVIKKDRPQNKKRFSGLAKAYADVKEGRVTRYNSVEDMFKAFGI